MADCPNHPTIAAAIPCARCAQTFCDRCTVRLLEQTYCGACKQVVARGLLTAPPRSTTADEALKYAIIGILCFGIILQPIAIIRAVQALREIEKNPKLAGQGKAIAALVIGSLFLLLNLAYIGLIAFAGVR